RHFLPAVDAHAAHDAGQRRFGDSLGFVDVLAGADGVDQVRVLLDVGDDVGLVAFVAVKRFAADDPLVGKRDALGADDALANAVLGAVHLPAHALDDGAVGVFEFDGFVVVDVAVDFARAGLPAADPVSADRRAVERPVHDVDVVDVLLKDLVAAKPGEIVPVADLPLQIGPPLLTRLEPGAELVPVALPGE